MHRAWSQWQCTAPARVSAAARTQGALVTRDPKIRGARGRNDRCSEDASCNGRCGCTASSTLARSLTRDRRCRDAVGVGAKSPRAPSPRPSRGLPGTCCGVPVARSSARVLTVVTASVATRNVAIVPPLGAAFSSSRCGPSQRQWRCCCWFWPSLHTRMVSHRCLCCARLQAVRLTLAPGLTCTVPPTDLVLVLDSSGSLGTDNWQAMLAFASNLVAKFPVGENDVR